MVVSLNLNHKTYKIKKNIQVSLFFRGFAFVPLLTGFFICPTLQKVLTFIMMAIKTHYLNMIIILGPIAVEKKE